MLADAEALPHWWPAVYLNSRRVAAGQESGEGGITEFVTKGWLPYTLRWRCRTTKVDLPHRIEIEASGDFLGKGVWALRQDGSWVQIQFDWQILAEKPFLRWLSFALKPVLGANHRWAMAQGEKSLRLELNRHRTGGAATVPPPPGPSYSSTPLLSLVGGFWIGRLLSFILRRARRQR